MNKPVVRYRSDMPAHIVIGLGALIHPIDHPNHHPEHRISNNRYILTSKVIDYDMESGEFETLNTKYKPQLHA